MPFKMGVLLIHGMGSQEAGYAEPMIQELRTRVRKKGSDPTQIAFEPVWWADVLAKKETELLRRMADGNDLDWMELRSFVVHSLADAIAYQDTYRPSSQDQINVYRMVHEKIALHMRTLRDRIRVGMDAAAPDVPLVVIAHSLGCHMVSNYIWDVRDSSSPNPVGNPFEDFQTLTGIVTFGCNIPLFTLAYTSLEPIRFPTPNLSAYFPPATPAQAIADVSQWTNYYDPDDVLGWPLRSLDPKFAAAVTRDVQVDSGRPWTSWSPLSHTAYWKDSEVTKPTADLLHRILELL